uniref:Uncharacterized protein n=1 Tax=Ditylenchus dipsaci TaxID=166011 RepID=A0A915CYF6_9BILA
MSKKFRDAFKRLFMEKIKTNEFKRDSWNSPTTVLSLRPNRNKPNGTTGYGIRTAAANATIVTIAGDDEDSSRALAETCALVPQNNENILIT